MLLEFFNRYESKKKKSVKFGMWSHSKKSSKVEQKDKEMEDRKWKEN
jgi:hypothetical protein